MKKFDWEDLRHFAALARMLNLAKAAASLRTSQVTVMRRVKALESSLGSTLFIRRKDGHRLTVAGKNLFAIAENVENSLNDVSKAVEVLDRGDQGHVRIATTELGANWLILPHIAGFQKAYPKIILELDTSPNALDLLEDSETLALRFRRPTEETHLAKRIGKISFALFASSKESKFAKLDECGPALRNMPYVGWAGPFGDIGVARWLTSVFEGRAPGLMLTTLQGQITAAQNGAGAIGLPIFLGKQVEDLAQIQQPHKSLVLEVWLVIPKQVRKMKRVDVVARFVEEAVRNSLREPN
jgi:DNA-binding transcriptional LysR family regulator